MVKNQRMPFSWLFTIADLAAMWKKRSHSELDQLEQVYKATINNMASGVIVLDRQNTVLSINEHAQRIINLVSNNKENNTFVGKSIGETLSIWPNLVRYLYSSNKGYRTLLTSDTESELRYYDVQIEPVYEEGEKASSETDRKEQLVGRFIVLHDCTERERSKRALRERKRQLRSMVEQLRKADRYQATLADSVQQELKDPLNKFHELVAELQGHSVPAHLETKIDDLQKEAVLLCKIVEGMDVFMLHRRPPPYYAESASKTTDTRAEKKSYRTESFH